MAPWAAYLKDWGGPVPGERPAAYIAVLCDRKGSPTPEIDLGIAAQTIQLGAQALGLGCCMIGAFDRDGVRAALGLDAEPFAALDIVLVLALGVPAETRVLDTVGEDGDIRYRPIAAMPTAPTACPSGPWPRCCCWPMATGTRIRGQAVITKERRAFRHTHRNTRAAPRVAGPQDTA